MNLTRAQSGTLIWDALAAASKLTKHQILLMTGLTAAQFTRGLEWIKDVFQGEQVQPITYDPRTHQYALAEHWRQVRDYANFTIKGLLTRSRRIASTLSAAMETFPD